MPKAKKTTAENSTTAADLNEVKLAEKKIVAPSISETEATEHAPTASAKEAKSAPAAPEETPSVKPQRKNTDRQSNVQKATKLLNASKEHLVHGRYDEAQEAGEQALTFYEKNRSRAGRADCHETLGIIAAMQANYNGAYDQYDKALALYAAIKDAENVVDVRQQIKRLDQLRGYA